MKKIKISVIGLGYVGLPLAYELGKKFKVLGIDANRERINQLKKYFDKNLEISKKDLKKCKYLTITNNYKKLSTCNVHIVTVPTPLKNKKPDLSLLKKACSKIALYLKKNDIVIFESTSYPGTSEDVCVPILEKISKLKFKKDFSIGYSPERINPGDKKHSLINSNKIISASDKKTLDKVYKIYKSIIKAKLHKAETIKVAEAAKIIENTQRDINVALMNEFYLLFNKMEINFDDVLKAANTKWNFLNFTPGLVGGHCIGVDPYYLTYIAKKNNYDPKIILAGRKINDSMPEMLKTKIYSFFKKKSVKNGKILILGATFKENCLDIRNSKSIELYKLLKKNRLIKTDLFDPLLIKNKINIKGIKIKEKLKKNYYDLIISTVKHDLIVKKTKKYFDNFGKKNYEFFDFKNVFKK
tara:strand:+ start:772 stop:2010 length:1239 start_codon:yes stop_codon:yes gene_type:complete